MPLVYKPCPDACPGPRHDVRPRPRADSLCYFKERTASSRSSAYFSSVKRPAFKAASDNPMSSEGLPPSPSGDPVLVLPELRRRRGNRAVIYG
ncbi:hypothetical protein DPEC_G00344910 [Dallia pectoralis]|uniref:Uncharacterized protein n=1 Tax=Dallia pectoralis TaxID=75939 RepID=A0ACC2F3F0_DALPE|nr:hypothetical protein DPEC_G00344910 [Dallia pectoralis]